MGGGVVEGASVAVGGTGVQGPPVQTADRHDTPTPIYDVDDGVAPNLGGAVTGDDPCVGAGG